MKVLATILLIGFGMSALADDKAPGLVRLITKNKTAIVGEVGRRNKTHIEVFDLKDGQPNVFKISDLMTLQDQVSDNHAIQTVGLPKYLAWKIKQSVPSGSGIGRVAKIDGATVYVSLGFVEELTTVLVNRGVPVVDRKHLETVLKELNLQQTKEFDPAKAQKIGKQIGAAAILTGTVVQKGRYAIAQLRLIRVDTGEIVCAVPHRMAGATVSGSPGVATTAPKAKTVAFLFAKEADIKKMWKLPEKWQIVNNALVLNSCTITSKFLIEGDCEIATAFHFNHQAAVNVFGEEYRMEEKGPHKLLIVRKKESLVFTDNGKKTAFVIKEEMQNKPSLLGVSSFGHTLTIDGVWIRADKLTMEEPLPAK